MGNKKDDSDELDVMPIVAKRKYIEEEQPKMDDVGVTFDPNRPKSVLKESIQSESIASNNISKNSIKMRRFKTDQMEEFANDYAISQVEQSGWSTFLNVLNTVLITIALALAFLVAFGLLFGLRSCAVISNSMEPFIQKGSLVITKPIDTNDINVGDVLSYRGNDGIMYIHRVSRIGHITEGFLVFYWEGDNKDLYPDEFPTPSRAETIQGKYVISVPYLGDMMLWIKSYWYVVVAAVITFIIGMCLIKKVVDSNHNKKVMQDYIERKVELEKRYKRKFKAYKSEHEKDEINALLNKGKE